MSYLNKQGRAQKINLLPGDPVREAYPHLRFYRDTNGKMIGEVKNSSEFRSSNFRSFSYSKYDSAAIDFLCIEFFDRVIKLWESH